MNKRIKKKQIKNKLRRVKDMTTMAMERASLKDFLDKNKEKIYSLAEQNTVRNSKGQTTISKSDPWFQEDEWDEHSRRMDNK